MLTTPILLSKQAQLWRMLTQLVCSVPSYWNDHAVSDDGKSCKKIQRSCKPVSKAVGKVPARHLIECKPRFQRPHCNSPYTGKGVMQYSTLSEIKSAEGSWALLTSSILEQASVCDKNFFTLHNQSELWPCAFRSFNLELIYKLAFFIIFVDSQPRKVGDHQKLPLICRSCLHCQPGQVVWRPQYHCPTRFHTIPSMLCCCWPNRDQTPVEYLNIE